ncbi:SDR family oxidoreductase [Ramlibacter henchirensis]|uniref:SDR family oxidoreductase n=1 Tax=Ramlibacter henchirensis TaxID=204072 RepID=A0A4Z0BV40_9BURK|nr:SDR family oxidoreductase [Ramlibacter henchirensis]TFZ02711.1 SDR family oxidoreductase [Ramlibacter henchirensis]
MDASTAATAVFAPFSLAGRCALVTGASSGLGAHFAGVLADAGAQVWLAARRTDRVQALVASLRQRGARAQGVELDVTRSISVAAAFDAMATAGTQPDIVINNAGVGLGTPALETSEGDWDDVVDTNLKGAWLVATEASRRLVAANRAGSIVNIASILGERVGAFVAPYAASKAGLIQLTKALALEWARHGIRVNALAPGYIATDINREFLASEAGDRMRKRIPQRRFGEARDLDGPLLLLASDAGRYMTGAVVAADGGHLVSGL